ncbi:GTP pyrophosphokinase [Paraliobacillus sp. PM-2]|uniref:HD domain-containing protein n=1 Tax=Paraliobacillus sp. PM-2 TaxID=1462524 RepID=UPI00061C28FF|nr:HD domain-containing protein [Paraliobacillus sp. PM-2]CQR48285.1 GTP pyrophosphokinase [Paraliobacillus sp. PM-2]
MLADKLICAITYATKKHEGQIRKVDGVPYIVHPYRVAMLLKEEGYNDDIVIAGLLHDVVEDTDGTIGEISNLFGNQIAKLVSFATEPDRNNTWEERKKHTIHHLKEAPLEARLVVCADKIDNIRSILENEKIFGSEIWKHFKSSKDSQRWYYQEIYKSLHTNLPTVSIPALFIQLEQLIEQF